VTTTGAGAESVTAATNTVTGDTQIETGSTQIEVRSPADATTVGTIPDCSAGDVAATVARVRAAQPDWEALGPGSRAQWLGRYRDWLLDHDVELADLLQAETAKPWQEATFEIPVVAELINYYAGHATEFLKETHPRPHGLLNAAHALVGGARSKLGGTFFEPTVLVDVDHSMDRMREESFGPTLPVMKVTDPEEAIRLANDSPYGLSATVWTRDPARGREIARRLDVGSVNVNDVFANLLSFPVPQSGWKQSGIGARFGGPYGIRKYCRAQSITETRIAPRSELLWYPYTARKGWLAARLVRFLNARDLRRRLGRR